MDPEADKLMAETFDKNMVDKDEYPATAAIESRCVSMVADLFRAEGLRDDDPATATGVSTIGSSEAVMLGGLALKWRWRQRVGDNPKTGWRTRTPNLVMGSNVQVVWEKFCRYFDVEPRYLPMEKGRYVITPSKWSTRSTRTPSAWSRSWAPPSPANWNPSRKSARRWTSSLPMAAWMSRCMSMRPSADFVVPFLQPDLVSDPAAAGGVDQRQRPQVRADLFRASALWCGAVTITCPRTWCSG